MGKATVMHLVNEYIAYSEPTIEDDEIKGVAEILRSGWLTMGPKTMDFEQRLQEYTGAKYAVAVNSCTAALHLSLLALDIGVGDEVITTPYTFASTGNVIVHSGAKPVFADVKKEDFNIDPEWIKEVITSKTKAILPVDFAGQPADMKEITEIAEDHGLFVIEDAAHAIGAEYLGKKTGTIADATCFSFYPTKSITTGEGGVILTDNIQIAERARLLRLHGISKDAWKRYSSEGSWFYEIEACGWKYNMTDIQAALGLAQLTKLNRFYQARKHLADIYSECLGKLQGVIIPREKSGRKHVFHLYPLLLKEYNRNRFMEEMARRSIGCSVHFIPLHLHPFYQKSFGFKKGDFPNAEWLYEREVSLPLYPNMSQESVHHVCDIIGEVLDEE